MASPRLSMRQIREVLRLRFECRRTQREIARALRLGNGTVAEYQQRVPPATVKTTSVFQAGAWSGRRSSATAASGVLPPGCQSWQDSRPEKSR